MQIQVNTDDNVEGREELVRQLEAEISRTLGRFGDHFTRVEVHLSDENSDKFGSIRGNDSRGDSQSDEPVAPPRGDG